MAFRRGAGEPPSPDEARAIALRCLARRDHAVAELRRKLADRGVDPATTEALITELSREGLLDDARFAESLCRQKVEAGHGEHRLRAELRRRGVGQAQAEAALSAWRGEWDDAVLGFARRRAGDLAVEKERARFYRAALRRGFSHEEVMRAIDRLREERSV